MMTLRTRLTLIAFACIGAVSAVLVAQQSLGEVAGMIVDPNDNVITGYSGAYVTMKDTTTDVEFQALLTTDGTFELTE